MDIDRFKKIGVIGWGRSGISLCRLLLSLKKEVKVSEIRESSCFRPSLINNFQKKGVQFEFAGHSTQFIKDCQLLILSPGVDALNSTIAKAACSLGIPVVGEVEFSSWLTKAKCIAITGTNGKTTTAHLTHKVLQRQKKRVFLGGNIGRPFSSFVLDTKKNDLIILEISSFQLETIISFRPYVAALLNITPDHLDRYQSFYDYFQTKTNIFKNQRLSDWAVLNKNINFISNIKKIIKSKVVFFSKEFSNENFSCVYRIANIFGLSKADCLNVFSKFFGLPHRLQLVREIKGITFINDSKATNPSSTIWALKNIKTPVIMLAGGYDKGLDYSLVTPYLKHVKKINLFGKASSKIKKSLNLMDKLESFSSLEDAVASSFRIAKPGDTVLFSPMCASFDMFANYEERGNKFIEIVNSLSDIV